MALINVLWYLQERDSVVALTGGTKTQFGGLCRTDTTGEGRGAASAAGGEDAGRDGKHKGTERAPLHLVG